MENQVAKDQVKVKAGGLLYFHFCSEWDCVLNANVMCHCYPQLVGGLPQDLQPIYSVASRVEPSQGFFNVTALIG